MPSVEHVFRTLTIGDRAASAMIGSDGRAAPSTLDAKTSALVRLAALVAADAPGSSYRSEVAAALRAGAREEDLLAVLLGVADLVGTARVVSAAPRIALAAGYDVEAALE